MADIDLEQITPSAPQAADAVFVRRGSGPYTAALVPLGTAAGSDVGDFATAAQGAKADTALQSGDSIPWSDVSGKPSFFSGAYADLTGRPTLGTASAAAAGDFATAAQGAKADTALQPGASIPWSDVTGKPSLFDGAYSSLSGIPSTFTPSAHSHDDATTSVAGFMSGADKTKLDGVATGAQVNVATDLGYTAASRLLTSSTGADVTLPLVSTTDAGLAPASGGGTTNFLRADGAWAAPAGGGGSPGGSTGQVQWNNEGVFDGATQVEIDADGNLVLLGNVSKPPPHASGLQLYGRSRAGAVWPEVQRPSGRDFPLQPHIGVNRICQWLPSTSTTVTAIGMPRTGVGTVSHPALASGSLINSTRRWRMTSAATASSVCDERVAATLCWRGNIPNAGGFTYINRISANTLQTGSVAFFGLLGVTSALSTTQVLTSLLNCVGVGFTNGTDTQWQIVYNDGSGTADKIALGANFPINTTDLLTIYIWSASNGSSVWVRVVNETMEEAFEQELTTNIPSASTFLSVRNFMHNGGVAAAVAYDCCGVYLETDF